MAKKKAGGSKAKQGGNVAGRRDGIKAFGGMLVKPGQIIIRQRGRTVVPGENVGMGRDFTIFSKISGMVHFKNIRKNKKKVDVIEQA